MGIEEDKFAQGGCGAPAKRGAKGGGNDAGAFGRVGWHQEIEHFPIRKRAVQSESGLSC